MKKDYLKEIKGKKIAITSVFSNITYNKKNHRGLETVYIRELLLEAGAEVDIIADKNRNYKDMDFYKNYEETDFSGYDIILLQLSPANFFGGQRGKHTETLIDNIANFGNLKNIHVLANDPRIKPKNPARIVNDRWGICSGAVSKWDDIFMRDCSWLFPGKDIKKFFGCDLESFKNTYDLNTFLYMFKRHYQSTGGLDELCTNNADDKEFDLVYFGDRRAGFREKQLRNYFPAETKNLLIGYKSPKVPGDFIKKLKHKDLMEKLDDCKVSLVTADEEHMDNVATYRFYEIMGSNCLAAIQIEYDPEKQLIQDPILRDLLYVSSQTDIINLIDAYSPEMINRQKKELKRILGL